MGQRPNELTPHESLQHYWGAELRALRTQRGMALADLAQQVHCDPSYLGKIERAERTISADLAASCDTALDAHGTLIRLHTLTESDHELAPKTPDQPPIHEDSNTPDEANHPSTLTNTTVLLPGADTGEEVIVPLRAADGRIVLVPVPRRLFLQGLGTTAAGLATAPMTISISGTTSLPADVNPIEHFQQTRQVLIESDSLFGPQHVIPAVQKQINIIQQLRTSWRGTDQQALVRVQAQYHQFYGWLYQDIGEYQLAESCVDRALALSQMAGDHDLTAYIMARKAQLAGDMGVCSDAIGAAEQALRMAPPRSRTAVVASMYAGHGYALGGDQMAMERAYDHALEHLDRMETEPHSPCGTGWLDETFIAVQRARSIATLGDHHGAAERFRHAIISLPPRYRRGRGLWLARAAIAETGDREVERAASLGLEALAIGAETGSAQILSELAHLENALAPWQPVPAVADFRTAMKDTLVWR